MNTSYIATKAVEVLEKEIDTTVGTILEEIAQNVAYNNLKDKEDVSSEELDDGIFSVLSELGAKYAPDLKNDLTASIKAYITYNIDGFIHEFLDEYISEKLPELRKKENI